MSDYHSRIMNLPIVEGGAWGNAVVHSRRAAAEIALEADKRIAALEAALKEYADEGNWLVYKDDRKTDCIWLGTDAEPNNSADGTKVAREALAPDTKEEK